MVAWGAALFWVGAAGVASAAVDPFEQCIGGRFAVKWSGSQLSVSDGCSGAFGADPREIWVSAGPPDTEPFLSASLGSFSISEKGTGTFKVSEQTNPRTSVQTIDSVSLGNSTVIINGTLQGPGDASILYSASLSVKTDGSSPGVVYIRAVVQDPRVSHVHLRYVAGPDESFHGLGEQYSVWDLRGRRVPVLTQEQGVGRGLEPITTILDAIDPLSGGEWHTTYTSVPHYITSELRSLFVSSGSYSLFDLTARDRAEVSVGVTAAERTEAGGAAVFQGGIVGGASMSEIIKHYTDVSGRMGPVAEWAACGGLVMGYEGGSAAVRSAWERVRNAGVVTSGLWLQDWSGSVQDAFGKRVLWNWDVDRTAYPDWETLIADLAATGARMLTYINPYLTNKPFPDPTGKRRFLFQEAEKAGFLVLNASGQPYIQASGTSGFTFGTVDLTNPDAREWYAMQVIARNMLFFDPNSTLTHSTSTGQLPSGAASGWMADFGEYIPFDSVLKGGSPGQWHGQFPELWAMTNEMAVSVAGRAGDVVYFMRSASLQSPGHTALFWAGDQLVTWDAHDGLKSYLYAVFSGGLSGMSMMHSDLGGYTMVDKCEGPLCVHYDRSCELLIRWGELNAVIDIMFRSHVGSAGINETRQCQVLTNEQTLGNFSMLSRLHGAFCGYRQDLMKEAQETGMPVARHPALVFPSDTNVTSLETQVMLGDLVLMAPVLDKGATTVTAYLPELNPGETWVRWPHNTTLPVGQTDIETPIGQPALIFRQPTFSTQYPKDWEALSALAPMALGETA